MRLAVPRRTVVLVPAFDEEDAIEASTREHSETPHFRGDD